MVIMSGALITCNIFANNALTDFTQSITNIISPITHKIKESREKRKRKIKEYVKDILNGTTIIHSVDLSNPGNKKLIKTAGVTAGGVLCIATGLYIMNCGLSDFNTSGMSALLKCSLGLLVTCAGFGCIAQSDNIINNNENQAK